MNILTISGSLRARSSNTELLRALAILAPAGVTVSQYEELGSLPHFNPDVDIEPAEEQVGRFRAQLKSADAVVISSPEYAHGVPGTLKNALDWIVSSGEFIEKPLALINASAHAAHAQDSLAETLTMMMARIVPGASITIPVQGAKLNAEAIAAHPDFAPALKGVLEALQHAAASVPALKAS